MYVPKGFSKKEWLEILEQFEPFKNIDELSDKDWEKLLNILKKFVKSRLGRLRKWGAHSERNLGMDALERYPIEAIAELLEGTQQWNVAINNLFEQLFKIINSIIGNEIEKYKEFKFEEYVEMGYFNDIESSIYIKDAKQYVDKLFTDPQLKKFASYRMDLDDGTRSEIIAGFNGNIELVDKLAKRYFRKMRSQQVRNDINSIFFNLHSNLENGYIRLLDEIFEDLNIYRILFLKQLKILFKKVEDWSLIEKMRIVTDTWEIRHKEKFLRMDEQYAVKVKFDSSENIIILNFKNNELNTVDVQNEEYCKENFIYVTEKPIDKSKQSYINDQLRKFNEADDYIII